MRMLARRLAETVERDRERTAIVSLRKSLTYGQMWDQAGRIGAALRSFLRDGAAVALVRHRDDLQALAVIACVRLGIPLVVMDPEIPAERLRSVLGLLPGGVFVGSDRVAPPALGRSWRPADTDALDDPEGGSAESAPAMPAARLDPVIMLATSGTSGRPKLVALDQPALDNRLNWACRRFGLNRDDRFIYCSAPGFDFGLFELLCPLYLGARVIIPDPDAHRDPATLLDAIGRHGATVLHGTPSMLRQLDDDLGRCPTLRIVFSGGEALPEDLAARIAEPGNAIVVNEYGPTETTIDSLAYEYTVGVPGRDWVPIGTPIDKTHIHIDDGGDGSRQGELLIGGIGLARGYHGDPRGTAASFVPDGRSPHAHGARLYRTGDIVRVDAGDVAHFVGRADEQVKVRGVRIEPGEIRAAFLRHPLVLDAVVGGVRTSDGIRLAGTIEVADDSVEPAELRRFTALYLPRAFQPEYLAVTESLPLLPNGKVDRQALEADWREALAARSVSQVAVRPIVADGAGAPPILDILLSVAREELGLDARSSSDNFFLLGGHSLLGARLVTSAGQRIGRTIPLRMLFAAADFGELAKTIEAGGADADA